MATMNRRDRRRAEAQQRAQGRPTKLVVRFMGNVDPSQPALESKLLTHICGYLRDFLYMAEGVITLDDGVEHLFTYKVTGDIVEMKLWRRDEAELDLNDALIARFLGSRYLGRCYLRYYELEALGLVDNRASLNVWMDAGAFPRAIKISGPYGKTLVWLAIEVARLIARRVAERDASSPDNG